MGIYPNYSVNGYAPLIQVGLITDSVGIRWFAYSIDGGITCTAGTPVGSFPNIPYGDGCIGDYGSYATFNQWQKFAFSWSSTYNYWDIAVYHPGSNSTYFNVGALTTGPADYDRIITAQQVAEEGYTDPSDPRLTMSFYSYHPSYAPPGSLTAQDWPASPTLGGPPASSSYGVGPNNYEQVTNPPSECPTVHGEVQDEQGDPQYWWTGSGGSACSTNPQF